MRFPARKKVKALATYAITGSEDANYFVIEADIGILRFAIPPDTLSPDTADSDGGYEVALTASDDNIILHDKLYAYSLITGETTLLSMRSRDLPMYLSFRMNQGFFIGLLAEGMW